MADETQDTGAEYDDEEEPGFWMDDAEDGAADGIGLVCDTLTEFLQTASVENVFAEPIVQGDTLVIPAAEVMAGMAFGVGSGYGSAPRQEGEEASPSGSGGGSGGGGGGRTFARPVAVIVVSPQGVRVEPVVDPTKIVLAALTAAGFVVAMISRMFTPSGRH